MPDQIILINPSDPTQIQINPAPVIQSPIITTLDDLNTQMSLLASKRQIIQDNIGTLMVKLNSLSADILTKQAQIDGAIQAGAMTYAQLHPPAPIGSPPDQPVDPGQGTGSDPIVP